MKKILILSIILLLFGSMSVFSQSTLYWHFDNAVYTPGTPSTYSFDVVIKSSDAGTFATGLTFKDFYNTDVFTNVIDANIIINPSFSTGWWLPSLTTGTPGEIAVSTALFSGTGYELPTATYVNFCTITLDINNPCEEVGISFVESFMNGGSTYQDAGGTTYYYTCSYEDDWTNESTGYAAPPTTSWAGTTGSDWLDASNWSDGVPCTGSVVTIPDVTNYPIMDVNGFCNGITISDGGKLTVNSGSTFTVGGDFLINSEAAGNGSFINNGTLSVTGSTTVQSYVTSGKWHGISSPVSGLTANDLYMGGSPDVWLKSYNEATDDYTNITDLNTSLGTMEGWFTWIETGASNVTYNFTGSLNSGPTSVSLTNDGLGYNFVGNPYSSAIDWDAASGWTKTNVNNAVYVYSNGSWLSYVGGAGTGSRYIAMNQGFFVQTTAAGSLAMTSDVCVHNAIPFRNTLIDQRIVNIQVESDGLADETVVRFADDATLDFDANLDAHKLFSFNEDYPQLYSTANNFMSINSLPMDYSDDIIMDVRGKNGSEMTISLNEAEDFDNVYLEDAFTGIVTDLKIASYTFNYNADITNRFSMFFSITGINDPTSKDIRIFAYDKKIQVVLDAQNNANITVYNLMGQKITSRTANSTVTVIPVVKSGYYVVKVSDGKSVSSQKVYINY